jgi:hypothetical protein
MIDISLVEFKTDVCLQVLILRVKEKENSVVLQNRKILTCF